MLFVKKDLSRTGGLKNSFNFFDEILFMFCGDSFVSIIGPVPWVVITGSNLDWNAKFYFWSSESIPS